MIEQQSQQEDLVIETREVTLRALLAVPEKARSIVLFAHGAGSSRHKPTEPACGPEAPGGRPGDLTAGSADGRRGADRHVYGSAAVRYPLPGGPAGHGGRLQLDPAMRETLRQKGIDCIEEPTGRAWQIFNDEIEHDRKVVGAFHLSC